MSLHINKTGLSAVNGKTAVPLPICPDNHYSPLNCDSKGKGFYKVRIHILYRFKKNYVGKNNHTLPDSFFQSFP